MGQQPLRITDTTVDPQHASLRRLDKDTFQIEYLQIVLYQILAY